MLELMTRLQAAGARIGTKMRREEGQTSSEYLVIAGVIVIAIIAILGMFRGQLESAASAIAKNIMDAVK